MEVTAGRSSGPPENLFVRGLLWWRRRPRPARLLMCGGLAVALIASFYAEENWRGRRAWEICRRELAAKGVELDFQKFAPPPVPDEQNFAMTPFLKPLFDFRPEPLEPGETRWRDTAGHERAVSVGAALVPQDNNGRIAPTMLDGRTCDLEVALRLLRGQTNGAFEASNSFPTRAAAAEALLQAILEYEPVLNELRAASHRPYCRFNIQYDAENPASILLPHFPVLIHISRLLQVRASAELALDKNTAAFEDLRLMIFLAESIRDEPFLMSQQRRVSLLNCDVQLLWEGLAAHRWTPEQLQASQMLLNRIDLIATAKRCLQGERAAFGNQLFRYVRTHKNAMRDMVASNNSSSGIEYLLIGPEGWLYQEQAVFHRLFGDRILTAFDPVTGRLRASVLESNQYALEDDISGSALRHHTAISKWLLENLPRIVRRTALAQTRLELAETACAVERFRLTKGALPENLEALVPEFLASVPLDVCTGRPLNFRRTDSDKFELGGAGWPETPPGAKKLITVGPELGPKPSDWTWPPYPSP